MIKHILLFVIGLLISISTYALEREIAITIDDLPFVGSANSDPKKLQREYDRFQQILQTLITYKVPATGFIIAGSIEKGQWKLLQEFRDAGCSLGNHTYSHKNLGYTSAEKYIEDVDKADKILDSVLTKPKFFRYPYLAEGQGDKKQEVYRYLKEHDYVIAPVTIDSKDFRLNTQLFAVPYRARPNYLPTLKKRYLAYIWNQTLKAEAKAEKQHMPNKQILLLHANLLNSHFLGDVLAMYQEHGYKFISLAQALDLQSAKTISRAPVSYSEHLKNLFQSFTGAR